MKKLSPQEKYYRQERRQQIREFKQNFGIKRGTTIYCEMKYVSRSGMMRVIDLVVIRKNKPLHVGYAAAQILGETWDHDRWGIRIGGAGMDMGFALVYALGHKLYPRGFKVDGVGRNGDRSGWDDDGGYALKHSWI